MTFLAWALVVIGCTVLAYRQGYREGIEVARRMGQLAVEQERSRCRTRIAQKLYGPQLIARPSAAGKN